MKINFGRYCLIASTLLISGILAGQSAHRADSLRILLRQATTDSVRYIRSLQLYTFYEELDRDSAGLYAALSMRAVEGNDQPIASAFAATRYAYQVTVSSGQYVEAYQLLLQAIKLIEDHPHEKNVWTVIPNNNPDSVRQLAMMFAHHMLGVLMYRTNNNEEALDYFSKAKERAITYKNDFRALLADMNMGRIYYELGQPDTALILELEAQEVALRSNQKRYLSYIHSVLGDIHLFKKDTASALRNYYQGVETGIALQNNSSLLRNYLRLNKHYLSVARPDSALRYAQLQRAIFDKLHIAEGLEVNQGVIYDQLHKSYLLHGQQDSAFRYAQLALMAIDTVNRNRIARLNEFQQFSFREQNRLREEASEKQLQQNKIRSYIFLCAAAIAVLIALLLYRNNRQKHKAKVLVEEAYHSLKSTQQQLLHAEKMASLGELTAGIAHEIQNPLNFVNNFAEVNAELIEEMRAELAMVRLRSPTDENLAAATDVAKTIEENENKIIFHGKRADGIVKSMLQHSRSSVGNKELIDINALLDEYLRLAYHGMRAKDKSFNVDLKTDFDPSIGKINVVAQDIGRVVLNIITNAFYVLSTEALAKVDTNTPLPPRGGTHNKPTVHVITSLLPPSGGKGAGAEIRITDNGPGMPKEILDKIFQPFFTTKPTGEGTGLGLSISHDIIKAHGGELKVDSREGEGSTFTILLPVQ